MDQLVIEKEEIGVSEIEEVIEKEEIGVSEIEEVIEEEAPSNDIIETKSQVEFVDNEFGIQCVLDPNQLRVSELIVAQEREVKVDEQMCAVEALEFVDFVGVEAICSNSNKHDIYLFSVLLSNSQVSLYIDEQQCDSRSNRLEERGNDENAIRENTEIMFANYVPLFYNSRKVMCKMRELKLFQLMGEEAKINCKMKFSSHSKSPEQARASRRVEGASNKYSGDFKPADSPSQQCKKLQKFVSGAWDSNWRWNYLICAAAINQAI